MESQNIIELIRKEIKLHSWIIISELITPDRLKNMKIKDMISEIETKYGDELIVDIKNTEIYSFDLVYDYFKWILFHCLDKNIEIDLSSDEFKDFKPEDIMRIYNRIDSEFFNYLLELLTTKPKE